MAAVSGRAARIPGGVTGVTGRSDGGQAVLRSRGSVHEAKREIFGAEANGETRRSCGEVPEGKLAKGPGVMANPGGAAECEKGGKCMFKFAKCTKCGRGECGMAGPDSRRSSTTSTASSENAARVVPVTKPRPQSPTLAAAALVVKETKSEEEEAPRYEATKASAGTGDDRTRVTCHVCGYKSVPQWLNDKAHCILTRSSIHGDPDMPENILKDLSSGRAPGEASTYKQAPGSAMESASGSCSKAPDGIHHWKYGKCNFCQQPEGKLVKGSGVIANPGGAGGCSKDGGKCMFLVLALQGSIFVQFSIILCPSQLSCDSRVIISCVFVWILEFG
ncbi:unnamed protein product [Durusdinium trenchii]|uniref:RanBP2-type domain-containing protein n=1 Tax=Durusdinium trenchii TaxID=1381693 RepID=A0ABP0SWT8_9DINO